MIDFFKTLYAFPFACAAWTFLALSGFFAYPYFFVTGFKAGQLRNFIYLQGKIIQIAIFFASGFHKKVVRLGDITAPSVLVANHPCTYDTFVFSSFGIKNHVGIAKGWPFKIPIYGKYIQKAGYINSDGKTAGEIIALAKQRLQSGLHISIFPEGTRSKKTGRFRSLAFETAIKCNAAVVPFAIQGLEEMLPPGKWWPKYARVTYIQLLPVSPENFSGEAADLRMAKFVKELIERQLEVKACAPVSAAADKETA
ncbi:MAG: 1-acyl-sn-glycerol-3-phosphate acyltransferase [Endomicrobium sp.]|jgi:1-acyl-sn-glycerol-3-phosphate acyltransferase|nr:1-acyl-sn-glycerol-3-phosphate acyltransferase [Endomicrobium sp.]